MDFNLTKEQLELQKRVRAFAIKELLPSVWYYDQRNELPRSIIDKALDAGIMNTDIPKEYGGLGYGRMESAIITEELSAVASALATTFFGNSLGMEPLLLSSNEAMKQKYLPKILNERKIICFAISEPMAGSDVGSIRLQAKQDGDDFILNGTKYWVTNSGVSDYMIVFATEDTNKKHKGICAFLVETSWEGIRVGKHIPKMGQRISNTCGVNFKNVRVPKDHLLAAPGEGFALAMKTFSRTRAIISAFAVGAARSAMEYAIDYVKKRRAFGTTISSFEMIQAKIAEMYQKVETSRLLAYKAAWEADSGVDSTVNASLAKFYSTESAFEVASDAMQLAGGYGYTKYFPFEELLRDIRLFMIYEGTSEVQRLVVAAHALNNYEAAMPRLEDLPIIRDFDPLVEGEEHKVWRCRICGYVHDGEKAPEECPMCFFPSTAFKQCSF